EPGKCHRDKGPAVIRRPPPPNGTPSASRKLGGWGNPPDQRQLCPSLPCFIYLFIFFLF
ncbi:hypothetical protein LY76DRAFT_682803, partial [Colletotrichum caudatum]